MSVSPYADLPPERFWRTGVSEQSPLSVKHLYRKRFEIQADDRIAAAGSCFAQHISRNLNAHGCNVLDVEPAPPGLTAHEAAERGFGLYSGRYGNIYTARQLHQLLMESEGKFEPANIVWEGRGRFYDSQRPNIEPNGFESAAAVLACRADHLRRVRQLISNVDLFIFTFGLTEAWVHRSTGTVYPTAPGTIAGEHDPSVYEFKNYTVSEVLADFIAVRRIIRSYNRKCKFLVTVSPVPLTATAADTHVLQATIYSKSVLRAACGELYQRFSDIDYFPSYELIASHFSRGFFYEANLRAVSPAGVNVAMQLFFEEHNKLTSGKPSPASDGAESDDVGHGPKAGRRAEVANDEDVVCEEAMLEAFAK
ncbi:GSCFA domain-containing protein [Reyranella sp.]|uniref:GSCFA domain-containing protein n=1 Tax=Reyranella sp. TaxID=1929291 RepID=UPI003BAADE07